MSPNYYPVNHLDSHFPFSVTTLYSGHCRGSYPWLTRVGPDGHRGRILWILVGEFNLFCLARGIKYQLIVEGAR